MCCLQKTMILAYLNSFLLVFFVLFYLLLLFMAESFTDTAKNQDHSSEKEESLLKKNELLIYESIYSTEPLFKIDMQKVGDQMNIKVSQAENDVKKDRDFWATLEKYIEEEQNGDVSSRLNKVQQKQKPQFKNAKEEVKDDATFCDDKAKEIRLQVRHLSEKTFRRTLKNYGYRMSDEIGVGGYGSVFRVLKDDQQFACKVIFKEIYQLKSDQGESPQLFYKVRARFNNEVEIMKRVTSHPNIISYVDSFSEVTTRKFSLQSSLDYEKKELIDKSLLQSETEDSPQNKIVFYNFFLIMEFANSSTLSFYVKNRRSMPENLVKGIFWSLVDAVKFLHSQKIVHRDIKLSNLLLHRKHIETSATSKGRRRSSVTFSYDVKLCDFGLSSIVDSKTEEILFVKPVGTSFYMSPQILRSYYFYYFIKSNKAVGYCPFKGDVWAIAVCIFYCLHGFYPLDVLCKPNKDERIVELKKIFENVDSQSSESNDEQYLNRFRGILRNFHYKLSFNCQELLRRMLEVDAKKRADIFEVAEQGYFKNM